MNEIYSSKFIRISYDKNQDLIEIIRTINTQLMTDEQYQYDVKKWLEAIETFKPKYQLIDETQMAYIITPKMQTWTNKNLVEPAIKISIRRVAILESKELFSKISIEQTMSEKRQIEFKYKYFDDKEKALKWLFLK